MLEEGQAAAAAGRFTGMSSAIMARKFPTPIIVVICVVFLGSMLLLQLFGGYGIPPPAYPSNMTNKHILELDHRFYNEHHLLELEENYYSEGSTSPNVDKSTVQIGRDLINQLIKDTGGDLKQDDPRLVNYVRKYMLLPPSRLPYNLTAKMYTDNPTQSGQNLVVLAQHRHRKLGFFIECGANDGEFFTNSLIFERDYKWSGLLIEAEPAVADVLMTKNRKAWVSPACLSTLPTPQVMNFYMDPNPSKIHSLLYRSEGMEKVFGYKPKKGHALPVLCIPLYTYLLALGVTTVDYFSLDVEGSDFDVIRTIPFDKVIFLMLEVEVQWVKEGKDAVRKFLEARDYVFLKDMGSDYIFAHSSLVRFNEELSNRRVILN